jgi:hypothetical protein
VFHASIVKWLTQCFFFHVVPGLLTLGDETEERKRAHRMNRKKKKKEEINKIQNFGEVLYLKGLIRL